MRRFQLGLSMVLLLAAGLSPVFGSGFDKAIDRVMPRVVKLYGLKAGLQEGYGSGIIVSEDGLVVTVFSLLIEASHLRAVTSDGRTWGMEIIARDRQRQLALLRLKPSWADTHNLAEGDLSANATSLPYFDLEQTIDLKPGEWMLAAGNAFKVAHGAEPVSLTHGVFSARTRLDARRRLRDFPYQGDVLVIDAITSNPGAPGGAVVNLEGAFVGMIGRSVISNYTHTHVNYAIPRDVLLEFVQHATSKKNAEEDRFVSALEKWGFKSRQPSKAPDVGIRVSKVGYRQVLPFVERVTRHSSAALAGVRKDDLILSINGRQVTDIKAYQKLMKRILPGETISMVLRRGRKIVTVRIVPEKP